MFLLGLFDLYGYCVSLVVLTSFLGGDNDAECHAHAQASTAVSPSWMNDSAAKTGKGTDRQVRRPAKATLDSGLQQVAEFWRAGDGDAAAFEEFVRTNFAGDQATLDTMFNRFQSTARTTRWPHA